ncbi:hypothetical protein AAA214_24225, partial [Parabacteroides goldsteinii]
ITMLFFSNHVDFTFPIFDETKLPITICLKAPQREDETQQPTTSADLSTLNIEIVEYSEKAIAVFGDTKPIKDVLKDLNGLFRANLTYNGERRAGWIYSRKQEQKVRETLAACIHA